jgi:phosphoglycerate dehydrogenase-like enzyme
MNSPKIVFHGEDIAAFSEGIASRLDRAAEIICLPNELNEKDKLIYAAADAIIAFHFDETLPTPTQLKLFHVPGAGFDAVQLSLLPKAAIVCNCFGHEQAISEYVLSAILTQQIPFAEADSLLRKKNWKYGSGVTLHEEIAGKTIGLVGYGRIGKAIANRAKAFEMKVIVVNRSAVAKSDPVTEYFALQDTAEFWPQCDFIVSSLPFNAETRNFIDAKEFAQMKSNAVLINVGRGKTINEEALYQTLKTKKIAGAIIDTWYQYPTSETPEIYPSLFPFQELDNIVMTPHMSAWTHGTLHRRQKVIAENLNFIFRGEKEKCVNVVRTALI